VPNTASRAGEVVLFDVYCLYATPRRNFLVPYSTIEGSHGNAMQMRYHTSHASAAQITLRRCGKVNPQTGHNKRQFITTLRHDMFPPAPG
jgi:hypothetical protein